MKVENGHSDQSSLKIVKDSQHIPFNKSSASGFELEYIADAIARGELVGDGYYTKKCHLLLEEKFGVIKVLLTPSCTHALEMSALLFDLQPGDEVIVPSFTFVSTVNAFVLRGAKPVFIDIRQDTLNLDETKLEALITLKTKAIIVVHYAGVGCEMDAIMEIAKRYNVVIVEDNAHGLFGRYKENYLGSFGAMSTLSFHGTKNFTCGEGGALVINDAQHIERAEIIREKGTNRNKFFRGQVDKYTWVDIGSSYLPSELQAAFLYAQLEQREKIQSTRKRIWQFYFDYLKEWTAKNSVQLPQVPSHCEQTYHMFYMLLPDLHTRTRFIAYLKSQNISAVFHYLPLHLSYMGKKFGCKIGDCPVTEDVSDRLVRLPFFNTITEDELQRVVETIQSFRAAA